MRMLPHSQQDCPAEGDTVFINVCNYICKQKSAVDFVATHRTPKLQQQYCCHPPCKTQESCLKEKGQGN